ncbi:hypothetical protein [Vibrio crassostreae]|uniref:hypothetical protein n=1 Tax=Vibrio crassostreae TaxID=246167 RepID=UPI001B30B2D0|nr:hypothetical protein [Vibrio crassostreae]
MYTYNDVKSELEGLTPTDLINLFASIEAKTERLITYLKSHHIHCYGETYQPQPRGQTIKTVEPRKINSDLLIESYRAEVAVGDITVPQKYVGIIQFMSASSEFIKPLVYSLNKDKTILKYGAITVYSSRAERRKFYATLKNGLITSTAYRQVLLLEGVESISASWTRTQKAPIQIGIEEAKNIDGLSVVEQGLVFDALHKGYQLYRPKNVRPHPTLTGFIKIGVNDYRRVPEKPSTPILVLRNDDQPVRYEPLSRYSFKDDIRVMQNKKASRLKEFIAHKGIYIVLK